MSFQAWLVLFLVGLPVLLILILSAMTVIARARDRHRLRLWGLSPGHEVIRRRGRWSWRTAL